MIGKVEESSLNIIRNEILDNIKAMRRMHQSTMEKLNSQKFTIENQRGFFYSKNEIDEAFKYYED